MLKCYLLANVYKFPQFSWQEYTQIFNYESKSNENQRSMKKIATQIDAAVRTASHQHELQA